MGVFTKGDVVPSERTAHSTTQAFGLGLITTALLIVTVLSVILFGAEDIAFGAVPAAVAAVATFVVWRFDQLWARIVGLVATLAIGLLAWFFVFGVFAVFSPIEFIVGLLTLIGFILALYGGIAAIVAGRSGTMGPTAAEQQIPRIVAAVLGVAVVISIVGYVATRSTVSEAEAAGATPIDMTKFEFDPVTQTMNSGGSLFVSNKDPVNHDFTLDELDIQVAFGPLSEKIVDLTAAPPGTYHYYCSIHAADGNDTDGMTGTITIEG